MSRLLTTWHSVRKPNAINEHIYIPDIIKALENPKWQPCGSYKSTHLHPYKIHAEEGYSIFFNKTYTQKNVLSQGQQFLVLNIIIHDLLSISTW